MIIRCLKFIIKDFKDNREFLNSSSHSKIFKKKDLFYSVDGLGESTWALRNEETLIRVIDISTPIKKVRTEVYRIIRDTNLTRDLKRLHNHTFQICGERLELSTDII